MLVSGVALVMIVLSAAAHTSTASSGSITVSVVEQINITVAPTSPTCSGGVNGSITFTINDAVPPSTVILENSSNMMVKTVTDVPNGVAETIDDLAAGLYCLTVIDAFGCSSKVPVNIPRGARVMINAPSCVPMVSPIDCCGGTATVSFTVSGGTAPYQSCLYENNQCRTSCIAYQDGQQCMNDVPAGDYELVVTDTYGCYASVAVLVPQPQLLTFTIKTSSRSCPKNRSKLKVKARGGTAPYSYRLDAGAFQNNGTFCSVKNGEHMITVKDAHGCMKTVRICVPLVSKASLVG